MSEPGQIEVFDALPQSYLDWRRSTLGRITDALEERLLIERIGPVRGLDVLDVGCGDGVLATKLAAAGAHVTGLDATPAMLAAAGERAARAGASLTLLHGDAEHLPFHDDSFDIIVSVATLCFTKDTTGPLRKMTRCLRPGGRVVLGELGKWSVWTAQRRIKAWLGSGLWRAARFRGAREWAALLKNAGLTNISVIGAIYYPPIAIAARLLARFDRLFGRRTNAGAAFLVLTAEKPAHETMGRRM